MKAALLLAICAFAHQEGNAEPIRYSKEELREKFKSMSEEQRNENCQKVRDKTDIEPESRDFWDFALECKKAEPQKKNTEVNPAPAQ